MLRGPPFYFLLNVTLRTLVFVRYFETIDGVGEHQHKKGSDRQVVVRPVSRISILENTSKSLSSSVAAGKRERRVQRALFKPSVSSGSDQADLTPYAHSGACCVISEACPLRGLFWGVRMGVLCMGL